MKRNKEINLIFSGDWHITDKTPENRCDDYFQTILGKIRFILDLGIKYDAELIIQPGDFCDSPQIPYDKLIQLINSLTSIDCYSNIYTIFGQHDMRYRTKENTVLSLLHHLSDKGDFVKLIMRHCFLSEKFIVYGYDYGEETIPIKKTDSIVIGVVHRFISLGTPPFWAKNSISARKFLHNNSFDVVVSGDNHEGFVYHYDNDIMKSHRDNESGVLMKDEKLLVNCGSLTRMNSDQINHKPFVVLFNINTREYKKIYIPIELPENIFKIDKIKKEKIENIELDNFIKGLSEHKSMSLSFEDNLRREIKHSKIPSSIVNIIETFLKEVGDSKQ